MQKKYQMYYLFSKSELFEAIYFCDEGNYIDAATLQTGVYPFGSILSKAIKILTPLLQRNHSPFLWEDEMLEEFSRFSVQSSSFSSSVSDDVSVQTVLRLLLVDRKYIAPDEKFDRLFELLRSYTTYICLCQDNQELCSVDKLNLLVNQNGNALPYRSIYAAKNDGQTVPLSKNEIIELLKQHQSPELPSEFAPALKKQRTALGKLHLPSTTVKVTKRKNIVNLTIEEPITRNPIIVEQLRLKEPVYVFDVHDIVDLILAVLQCVFEAGYIIRQCSYCGNLFVSHRGNQKYCPIPTSTSELKSCYQLAKGQRQLEKERSGSAKMDKSIRTMYATKFGTDSEIYNNYIIESRNWREEIRVGKATEEEYVAWLKTHYRRKYREKNTAAET